MAEKLLKKKITGIGYETVVLDNGSIPLLAPMSEIAGRLSVFMANACLEPKNGGKGLLISGVPGVHDAKIAIIGGGIAGMNAAYIALGVGARVVIIDMNIDRLRYLDLVFHSRAETLISNSTNIEESVVSADIVIGSVLIPGAKAPKLVKEEHLSRMSRGSAFVDIAIDQGGCSETSRPTTHDHPMYVAHDVVHYCVTNMPGAVPRTATFALTNVTLPYIISIADKGAEKAMSRNNALLRGLNFYKGRLTHKEVAEALGIAYEEAEF
jgi:alanine dehydrogenase